MGKHKNKFSPRRSADDDLSAATAAAADGGDDGLLSPAADTDESGDGDAKLKSVDNAGKHGPSAAPLRPRYSMGDEPVDYIEAEVRQPTSRTPGQDDDTAAQAAAEELMSQEMVEYFKELIYYVAMVPDGELNSEDAEDMLRYICNVPSDEHPEMFKAGVLQAVYNVMDRASEVEGLQFLACHTLRYLSSTPAGETAAMEGGVVERLIFTGQTCAAFEDITAVVVCSLAEMACSETGQAKMIETEAHVLIHDILANSSPAQVQHRRWGCAALAFIADENEEGQAALLEAGVIGAIVACLKDHKKVPADGGVCQLAVLALDRILRLPAARAKFLEGNKTGLLPTTNLKLMLAGMENQLDNMVVQEHGCRALLSLAQGSAPDTRPSELVALRNSGTEATLAKTIEACAADANVRSQAEHALATMSNGYVGYMYHLTQAVISDVRGWGAETSTSPDKAVA